MLIAFWQNGLTLEIFLCKFLKYEGGVWDTSIILCLYLCMWCDWDVFNILIGWGVWVCKVHGLWRVYKRQQAMWLSLSCEWCNVENKKWNVKWAHVVLVFGERESRELLERESRELLERERESRELLEKSATVRTILGVLSLVSGVWAAVHVLIGLDLSGRGGLRLFFYFGGHLSSL